MIERPCRNRSSRIPVVVGQGIQHRVQTLWDRADENLAVLGAAAMSSIALRHHMSACPSRDATPQKTLPLINSARGYTRSVDNRPTPKEPQRSRTWLTLRSSHPARVPAGGSAWCGWPTGSGVSTLSVVNCAMRCWYAARATPGITPAPASAAAGLVQSVRPLCQRSVRGRQHRRVTPCLANAGRAISGHCCMPGCRRCNGQLHGADPINGQLHCADPING